MKRTLLLMLVLVITGISSSLAAIPFQDAAGEEEKANGKIIAFQGTLYENGLAVTGERTFTFVIPLDDGESWTETQENVQIIEGLYSVALGSVAPIPESLFYGVMERELSIKIGNTELGRTKLYSPFSPSDRENFGIANFELESLSDNDSLAVNARIYGSGGKTRNAAIRGLAETDSTNIGVRGDGTANENNTKFQYGVWGDAESYNPEAWAHGVMGSAWSNGAIAYGVRGQVSGEGSTFNSAVRGLNFVIPGENGVRYGGYFNTYSGDNSPYSGRSIGARGTATGSQENIGVFGSAGGPEGTTNWAGWFEGDVRTTNEMIVSPEDENPSRFGISPSQATAHGPDTEVNSILGFNWLNGGDRYANRGALFLFGDTTERFNREGADIRRVELTVRDNEVDGGSVGDLKLRAYDGDMFKGGISTRDGINSGELNLASSNGFDFARINMNEQNAGRIELRSAVDSLSVLIGSNGPKAGYMALNDSLGRTAMDMLAYAGNASQLRMFAGTPDNGEEDPNNQTRVTAQYVGGASPFINLIGRNSDGTAIGRVQAGRLQGFDGTGLRVTDGDFRWLATMQGDAENGGQISLEGPSSSNFWLGRKDWENSNLPYLAMRGENTVEDGSGGSFTPDAISFEVSRYDDGADVGVLHLRRIIDGQEEAIGMDFFQLQELLNPSAYTVNGVNGNQVAKLERRADNYGQAVFFNDDNQVKAEIGSFGDNSGFLQLFAPNGTKNMQLGGSDGNREYGMLKLFDNNGNDMFQLDAEDNNGNQVPYFRMANPQKLDDNDYPQEALRMGLASDNNGDGKYSTYLTMEGPDAPLIQMGAQTWDSNDGSNRARIALFGSDEESDDSGNTYTPERANLSVAKDAGSTEYGVLNLSNSTGGGFEIGARSWENNDQGGNRTYTAILSTIDVDDGQGGSYRPWLVSQEFNVDDNGNQFGTVRVSSTDNTGFASINDGNSGNIDISGSLNQSSDRRLKTNITTLTSGLAMVNQLRGVRFNWKAENRKGEKIGFIAQEVEQVLPELVKTRENGFKGVNYAEMTAVLVEAVKELSKQIEELKSENATLKAEASKVQTLEDRLSRIEALLTNPSTINANQK